VPKLSDLTLEEGKKYLGLKFFEMHKDFLTECSTLYEDDFPVPVFDLKPKDETDTFKEKNEDSNPREKDVFDDPVVDPVIVAEAVENLPDPANEDLADPVVENLPDPANEDLPDPANEDLPDPAHEDLSDPVLEDLPDPDLKKDTDNDDDPSAKSSKKTNNKSTVVQTENKDTSEPENNEGSVVSSGEDEEEESSSSSSSGSDEKTLLGFSPDSSPKIPALEEPKDLINLNNP
jgi:hypothetical protein